MTSNITAITARLFLRSEAGSAEHWQPAALWPVPLLLVLVVAAWKFSVTGLGKQGLEMEWLARQTRPSATWADLALRAANLPFGDLDPEVLELSGRLFAGMATLRADEKSRIADWRAARADLVAALRLRPHWSFGWLNYALVEQRLNPTGGRWKLALREAIDRGDRGANFQRELLKFLVQADPFLDEASRTLIEDSLAKHLTDAYRSPWPDEFRWKSLSERTLCRAPVTPYWQQRCAERRR